MPVTTKGDRLSGRWQEATVAMAMTKKPVPYMPNFRKSFSPGGKA